MRKKVTTDCESKSSASTDKFNVIRLTINVKCRRHVVVCSGLTKRNVDELSKSNYKELTML